jgi:hypothetical protein
MTFDFDRIVSTLARHRVAYVLVGGVAAAAHLAFRNEAPKRPTTRESKTAPSRAPHRFDWPLTLPGGQARAWRSSRRWKRSTWPAVSMMFCLPV